MILDRAVIEAAEPRVSTRNRVIATRGRNDGVESIDLDTPPR